MAKDTKMLKDAFGVDEYGFAAVPNKISNVKISRFKNYLDMGGCPFCFPHGWECTNSTRGKNFRNWKHHRKSQYKDAGEKNYRGNILKYRKGYNL